MTIKHPADWAVLHLENQNQETTLETHAWKNDWKIMPF